MDALSQEAFDLISPIPDTVYKKSPAKKDGKKPEKKKSSGWF